MTRTSRRIVMALCAFFVLSLTLAACGDDSGSIPGDAVAVVDGDPITKAEYQRMAEITAKGAAASGGSTVVPDPPTYAKCIDALRDAAKPAKGQPKPSDATLKAQCREQNEQLVDQVMAQLVQALWIEKEAEEQGVTATDEEIEKLLDQTKEQSFPTAKAYDRFLKQSGMTQADVNDRLRTQVLAQELTEKIQKSAAAVTDAQVADYYNENKAQFAVPERRDLEIILTKTEAKANEAKAAVEGGTKWADAAKRFSTDAVSKAAGGVLRGVAEGQQDRALDKAAFAADKGQILGPVKGQFGWYVVRVTKIEAPEQTSLKDAEAQIRPLLEQQGQQEKMQTFATDFQKRWTDLTDCRSGYIVELCSNAPKPKTTSTSGGTVATTPPSTSGNDG